MRADFYLIDKPRFRAEPLRLVCELARKAHDAGFASLILVRDMAEAETLDDLLWSFDPEAFIPHQIAGNEEDDETPVLIVPPDIDTPMRALVINLRPAPVEGDFERVLEVVPADPAARAPLRERWRQYQARGLSVHKHDM